MEDVITSRYNLMVFCIKTLEKVGLSADDAKIVADVLIVNEMRGIKSHGLVYLNQYIKQIKLGTVNKNATLEIIREGPAWALVDGNFGLGIITAYKSMKIAIKKAKQNGIGMICVRKSQHFAAAGYYSSMCADENMIGIAMSNGWPTMTIPGAVGRVIGNNPFSYALPANEGQSICLDIAMSKVAGTKLEIASKENQKIPNDWLIDSAGRPTTDPDEYSKGGALLPFGEHKGYGLAVMVECLAAALSGASMTKDAESFRVRPQNNGDIGHFFVAIDIDQIIPIKEFKYRIDRFINEIKTTPKAEGIKDIFFPGEMELLNEINSTKNGIKIGQVAINALKTLASELGLDLNLSV